MIEVLNFAISPSATKIAYVSVRYHDLVLNCDLVYHVKAKKAWIRMPEKWVKVDKKTTFVYWPSREKSDAFQKEVLKQLFDKHDMNMEKMKKLHSEARIKRGKSKKV